MRMTMFVLAMSMLTSVPALADQRSGAALKDLKVEDSASPELVGHLAKGLSISPGQAEGAAGALMGLAKSKLSTAEFGEVSKAVPGMDSLLKMAPAMLGGNVGSSLGGLMSLAGSFKQLGLDPALIAKAAPLITGFLNGKGAGGAAKLLTGVFK
jgi:hypothetical protein